MMQILRELDLPYWKWTTRLNSFTLSFPSF